MNVQSAEIIFLEPFFSGSHRAMAEGWKNASRHHLLILSLPGRFWKWRMRAAAFEFVRIIREKGLQPEMIFSTSLLDMAHLRALLGRGCPPLVLYFHECQSSYPSRDGAPPKERDYQYLVTDLASAAAADRVLFNSGSLRDSFFATTRTFLERMPDARPLWLLDEIENKCAVLHQGIGLAALDRGRTGREGVPAILWPHRWEHDKNPEVFFEVLEELDARGVDFRLLVAGARFGRIPAVFERARSTLAKHLDHWGEASGREEWGALLKRADIVVSTASHETFGIAMIEAAYCGAQPVAPLRQSYPEVIPTELHSRCLYADRGALVEKLESLLTGEEQILSPEYLKRIFSRYDWKNRIADFDNLPYEISKKTNM